MERQIWKQHRTWRLLISSFILLSATSFALADNSPMFSFYDMLPNGNTTYKQGELIVCFSDVKSGTRLKDGPMIVGPLTQRAIKNKISDFIISGSFVTKEHEQIKPGLAVVEIPEGVSVLSALIKFNRSANILYAEPNYKIRLNYIPNDPAFFTQWGLNNTGQIYIPPNTSGLPDADIDAPEGWDIPLNLGLSSTVVVAVTDTGIDYTHPDLARNMWINPGEVIYPGVVTEDDFNDVDDDDNTYVDDIYGYDFVDNDGDPMDEHYHGTHVAGIIGAVGDNFMGIAGVCWKVNWGVRLMALRILDDQGMGDTDTAIDSIIYATNMGADVINASWGNYEYSATLYFAIATARYSGILFVAAAGNDSISNDANSVYPLNPQYPASYNLDNIISVMSTDDSDNMSSFSNWGPTLVDLGAPGESIYSTTPIDETDAMGDEGISTQYEFLSGTSAAASHVSGAVALMRGINPDLPYDEIKALLLKGVDPVLPGLCVSGGRLNLYKVLHMSQKGAVVNTRTHISYPTIQQAIDVAINGDTLVAQSDRWYFETINLAVPGKKITLRSGIADVTAPYYYGVIQPENTYISAFLKRHRTGYGYVGPVVTCDNDPGSTLSGFTIIDGDNGIGCWDSLPVVSKCIITKNEGTGINCWNSPSVISDCIITSNEDTGIYCDSSNPDISGCTITMNASQGNGGGIYCSYGSNPDINDCLITGNTTIGRGGGIYLDSGTNVDIRECTISQNEAEWEGGGIYLNNISATITDSHITGCISHWDGGGIYCDSESEPDITNCTINNNIADYDGGGIYCNSTSPLIKNCLIVNNTVDSWDCGGVFCWEASPTITNCTFAHNSSNEFDGVGGALFCLGTSNPTVTNCIFSNNKDIAIYEYDPASDPSVGFCLFYNNPDGDYYDYETGLHKGPGQVGSIPGGSNNLYANPMFVPGRLGDYYLSQFDAGQILNVNGVPVDPGVNPQDANSPAVDAGSANADTLGMHIYSTRTDNYTYPSGYKDSGLVDIGFHYNDPLLPKTYNLYTYAIHGTISPPSGSHIQYKQVLLKAAPADPAAYRLKSWTGTDNDASMQLWNIVTMDSSKSVTVEFETVLVELRCRVIGGNGTVVPTSPQPVESFRGRYKYYRGTVVKLTATPANLEDRARWSRDVDDEFTIMLTNTVTMANSPKPFQIDPQGKEFKEVEVEFYTPRLLNVPGDYTNIYSAINDATRGDIIIIAPGVYSYEPAQHPYGNIITIDSKAITITSTNPDDPDVVAATIIDGRFVIYNVNRDTIIDGLTIQNSAVVSWGMTNPPAGSGNDGLPGNGYEGGGMELLYNASPTVRNCRFEGCYVWGAHGSNGNNGLDLRGSPGNGGWAGWAYGGAVVCGYYSDPIFTNCSFIDCWARGGDAGNGGDNPGGHGGNWEEQFWDGTSWIWDYGPFQPHWKYSGYGGAIYCHPYSAPEFVDCNFINNHTYGGSCGITGTPYLVTWPRNHYKIDSFGGAVYAAAVSSPAFTGCNFINNEADVAGPTTHARDGEIPINYDPYISYGGAVAFEDGANLTFNNCTFNNNLATIGGGMWATWADTNIVDCSFIQNTAYHGGGVYFVGCPFTITQSNFSENHTEYDTSIADPINPQEVLGEGGAIYCFDSNATIADCIINNNRADSSGGGIYISGSSAIPLVKNCLINNNTASRDGGGISANWYSKAKINNCTITGNLVTGYGFESGYGGGLYCSYNAYVIVINSIIWNNLIIGGQGSQLAIATGFKYNPMPSNLDISYSDVGFRPVKYELIDANGLPTIRPGFDANSLAANDDESTGLVDIGFEINFFGKTYPQLYVNNNGNVTFDANMWTYTPFGLTGNIGTSIIAPFFADVDTRPSAVSTGALTRYGIGTVDGHAAFGVTWIDVGYFGIHWDKLNSFQLILIDRSDRGPGDFDIEFNYEKIQWETGDASNGVNGFGGYSARAGFSNGTGTRGTFYEFEGSGVHGAFLDTSPTGLIYGSRRSYVDGRYIFAVQSGVPELLPIADPIYVYANCTLNGWDWNADTNNWESNFADFHNIDEDPLFIAGYYLSQIAAGQTVDSNCVDSGSANANAPEIGLDTYTTRTDSFPDTYDPNNPDSNSVIVDMGYHYSPFVVPQYKLTFLVINASEPNWPVPVIIEPNIYAPDYDGYYNWYTTVRLRIDSNYDSNYYQVWWTGTDDDSLNGPTNSVTLDKSKLVTVRFVKTKYDLTIKVDGGNGRLSAKWLDNDDPCNIEAPSTNKPIRFGTVVQLTAHPAEGYRVKRWIGTDDDNSRARTNTVTMNSDKTVRVEFGQPVTINVPGDYTNLQDAINNAGEGDIVLIAPSNQPYYTVRGYEIIDKTVTITGTNPDDPNIVARTVIQMRLPGPDGTVGQAFRFYYVDSNTVLNGLTITGFQMYANPSGIDGDSDQGYWDGIPGGDMYGSGILCVLASPTIKNCIITDCSATGGDGGDGADGDEIHPDGGHGGWPGQAGGGGIACIANSNPIVLNCTFNNCHAIGGNGGNGGNGNDEPLGDGGRGGGWFYPTAPNTDYEWGPFNSSYTWYSGHGGAAYADETSSPAFIDCTFTNNSSEGGTCGISGVTPYEPDWRDEPTINWKIDNFGGAVYLGGYTDYYYYIGTNEAIFKNCTFINNMADPNIAPDSEDEFVSYGGAIAFEEGVYPNFEKCTFNDNMASIGGAMYWEDAEPLISDCNFVANQGIHGGGVYFTGGLAKIAQSDFSENQATSNIISMSNPNFDPLNPPELFGQGGGIHCFDANALIVDCNINNNDADSSGGGIYIGSSGPIQIKNCLITSNSANRDGGGISANWYSEAYISNCTITDNKVTGDGFESGYGGGLYCSYNSYTNIVNSIIWDNLIHIGGKGSQLAIATGSKYNLMPSTVKITYSDLQGATDPNAFGARRKTLDLVFCIDTTGSMWDDIDAVQEAASEITSAIADNIPDFRIAVVDYKDFNQPNLDPAITVPYGDDSDYPYRTDLTFTTDANEVVDAINSLTTSGGADGPESVYTALMHCIDHTSLEEALGGELYGADPASKGPGAWRSGNVLRVIILMGDAPPHDPEPFTDYTLGDITAAAARGESKVIMPLLIGNDPDAASYFGDLASETGGSVMQAASAEEVVEALLKAIDLISLIPDPIFIDAYCSLNWNPTSFRWDPNSYNIDEDPFFVAGYYLSQFNANQTVESNCVDGGNADANHPSIRLDIYTTRTDSVPDTDRVDMGYHYLPFLLPRYKLTIKADDLTVITHPPSYDGYYNWYQTVRLSIDSTYDPNIYQISWTGTDDVNLTGPSNTVTMDSDRTVTARLVKSKHDLSIEVDGGNGRLSAEWLENGVTHIIKDPNTESIKFDTVVQLTATPNEDYRVKRWIGTGNDSSRARTNTVTMNSDRTVRVEFETGKTITVPGDYSSIQQALNSAEECDRIVVSPGTYMTSTGYNIYDKTVTITSTNPDDPCVAANTIIEMIFPEDAIGWVWHAFTFYNVGRKAVLSGFTIRGFNLEALNGGNGGGIELSGENGDNFIGGAIVCYNASPTIKNCIITDCSIIGGDGGNGANGTEEHPEGGHGGWPGRAAGAGLACQFNSNPTVTNCIFRNCLVTGGNGGNGGNGNDDPPGKGGRGGGWDYAYEVDWPYAYSVNPTEFYMSGDYIFPTYSYGEYDTYTKYSGLGGAVFVGPGCSPSFTACTFEGNQSSGGNCGICGQDNGDEGRDEPGLNWKIDNLGGAVYCDANSSPEFVDCIFTDNVADPNRPVNNDDPYVSCGGAVAFVDGATPMFKNCTFNDNFATIGGAIYLKDADVWIVDSNCLLNSAYQGGGIYGTNGSATIETSIIQKNFAGVEPNDIINANIIRGQGGGVYSNSMITNIFDSTLIHNLASISGGGIYLIGPSDTQIINNLITDNIAGRDGGGISINWYAEPLISNCTFVSNAAAGTFGEVGKTGLGGGLYCSYKSNSEVIDSIFWNNYALKGSELAVGSGFEFDPRPSTLTVSYSDIKAGALAIYVENGCTLFGWNKISSSWSPVTHNINNNPLFVSGPLGNYYLSQTDAGQSQNSPCVNSGSDLASNLDMIMRLSDMVGYTTRTDGEFDKGIVDMGYHYASTIEACKLCDLSREIRTDKVCIDFNDLAEFVLHWLDQNCSDGDNWCAGADFTFNGRVDLTDYALFANCWFAQDTKAPVPNPSEWQIEPYLISASSIGMSAETSFDAWGWGVEYFFKCAYGNCHDSSWQSSPTYTDSGLASGAIYGYLVKARDELGNETEWSEIRYAGQEDTTPPAPAPYINSIEALGPNSITMTATIAYDGSGMEYYFDSDTVGGHDSGWLEFAPGEEPNYTDTGLEPVTTYYYRVKARDKSDAHNETAWSNWVSATTTLALDNLPPQPNPMAWDMVVDANGFTGEPRLVHLSPYGTFDWYATMTATAAVDVAPLGVAPSGVEYRFVCVTSGKSALSSPWQIGLTYTVQVGGRYVVTDWYVIARDTSPNHNTTAASPVVRALAP